MNKLTIAVLTFNRANYLVKMLDSILKQTYKDFNVIIYDNCSSDNTSQIVQPFLNDKRFSYHRHNAPVYNINYALNNCKTEYLTIAHDDDIMNPDMIKEQISILELHDDVSMVCTNINYIDTNGNITRSSIIRHASVNNSYIVKGREYINVLLKKNNFVICPTVMFRMKVIKENNLQFRQEIGGTADLFFWFELNQLNYNFYFINKNLYNYRIHEGQDSKNTLFLLPLLRRPVFELLANHNYSNFTKNSWLCWIDKRIIVEINKHLNKKEAFESIKNKFLFNNSKDFFLIIGIFYIIYTPSFLKALFYLPIKILKKIKKALSSND